MTSNLKIYPSLWFAGNADEAIKHYIKVFPNSSIDHTDYYTEIGHEHHQMAAGAVLCIEFVLNGTRFNAINGPASFPFSQAVSFTIDCEDQKEVDYYWSALGEGGKPLECGWIVDKFGMHWQIVPKQLNELSKKGSEKQTRAVFQAMMGMQKLDVAVFQKAFDDAA